MSLGSGFYFWALRLFRTPRNLGSSHEKRGLLLLMALIVRDAQATSIDSLASLAAGGPEARAGTLRVAVRDHLTSQA